MPAVVVEAQLVGSDMTADNASLKITSAGVSGVMWDLTIPMIPMVGCDIYKVEEAGADLNVDWYEKGTHRWLNSQGCGKRSRKCLVRRLESKRDKVCVKLELSERN